GRQERERRGGTESVPLHRCFWKSLRAGEKQFERNDKTSEKCCAINLKNGRLKSLPILNLTVIAKTVCRIFPTLSFRFVEGEGLLDQSRFARRRGFDRFGVFFRFA
ncbi:MAG: hypothetical protein WKG07_40695, partial [Hymenobacter sp.]